MEFRILGPFEASLDAVPLALTRGKQKALLALLLLHADRVVAVDRIIDDLWGDPMPETAPKMVQILVSQLRKQLPRGFLRTRAPGYLVDLTGHTLDLREFEALARAGRAALDEGRAEAATASLGAALACWRGPALGEFDEPFAQLESYRLEEQRLACLEDRIDADLALARAAELTGELDALVRRHPLRERLRGQLMLALYGSGRQAEALASYQEFRRMLDDDLGIEPSARLKHLERRMLQQDPELEAARAAPPPALPSPVPVAPAAARAAACPSCGHSLPAESQFCPSCGASVTAASPAEEMLKVVTVLFADIADSTAWAEDLHPEDVRALMTGYFDAMAAEIRAEGGTVEKFVGDAIMAVFGVPTAREDDAVRAVRAAHRMLERLRTWNAEQEGAHGLEIRIGVNTGDVIASGAPGGDQLVAGDAVNVAARLQQVARPGTIVAGGRTARAARSHFELRELAEPLGLKGKAQPVTGWLVGTEREVAEERGVPGLEAPIVGRDHELTSLRTAFERVSSGRRPELVTILGDAGVGKTRLVREFVSRLDGGATLLIGRCVPYGQRVTFAPLADILKAEAVVFDTDTAATGTAKIAQFVESSIDADLAADRPRIAAALASTLGFPAQDETFASLDPRDLYHELIAAWRAVLASAARRAPVVAVFEDLHWADATMLDVLDELAERLDGPILFVGTARPDLVRSRPHWGGGRRSFSSLPIDPLGAAESAQLISLLLDVDAVPERTRREILDRSEGNPFFLEEIIRRLIDDDLLVRENGRWVARDRIERFELPDSVQAVILSRLDLLSPDEKRVAQRAAVVGRRFWEGAVGALAPVGDLDAILRTLRRREFIVESMSSSIAGEREFLFKHVLIRDVTYESLPRRERGRAHAEAAAWLERTSGELSERLAHHNDAAFTYLGTDDLRQRARADLLVAAANAHRRFAIEQGERYARRAVELSQAGSERLEALEALGDICHLGNSGDAAWRTYCDALAETSESDPAFARLAGKAGLYGARWVGTSHELPPAADVRRVIEAGLRAAPEPGPERTMLLIDRGFLVLQREGRLGDEARAAIGEAEAAARELDDPDLLSAALDLVQAEPLYAGRYGDMYRVERSELVPRMTDPREIGDTHATTAWAAQHLGRYREAVVHASACIDRSQGTDAGSYVHGLTWRACARFMLGDWDGMVVDQAEIERVAALGARDLPAAYTIRGYMHAALCHELRGDHAAADPYIELGLRYFEHRMRLQEEPPSLQVPPLALTLARRERFDEALAVLPLRPHSSSAGLTLEILCDVTAARGAWEEARGVIAAARDEAAVGEQLSLPCYADRLEGRTAAAADDADEAAALLLRAADGFGALGARWEEAWSRLLLAEVLAESNPVLAGRELAAALPVFEQLGSVVETQRARVLLAGVGA